MNLNTLHEHYRHLFESLKSRKPCYDNVFFMAVDAEWYLRNARNTVISYQMATCAENCTRNVIKYIEQGERLSLANIIEIGLDSVLSEPELARIKAEKNLVVIISHNVAAEWSVLADRDEPYITKKLTQVRKQPITGRRKIELIINGSVPVSVKIYDTMLLAPASQGSLKKLSTLTGSDQWKKIAISQHYLENMDLFQREKPTEYKEYALMDSAVTLMLFLLLQDLLNKLVGRESDNIKLYSTLASAAVESFTIREEWFNEYRYKLQYKNPTAYRLVTRCYYGGRNEAYFVGRTNECPETRNKIWIDIDLIGCYPTAMALCPKIDFSKEIIHKTRNYSITDDVIGKLEKEKIPEDTILGAQKALAVSSKEFDHYLMQLKNKAHSYRIREHASVFDNSLVNNWYERWQKAKRSKMFQKMEEVALPGFARVRFEFPPDTQFPCLPIRHPRFGLLYVLKGETTASASEIVLAMEAGATINAITSIELPIQKIIEEDKESGGATVKPDRFALKHLTTLAQLRKEYQKQFAADSSNTEADVMQRLLKEFSNSLYGKYAQSINPRNVHNPSTGEKEKLGKSLITEPCTASLITALARSALSAILLEIEKYNKGKSRAEEITVVSATTDGLLIGVPVEEGFTVYDDYYEKSPDRPKLKIQAVADKLPEILKRFGHEKLLDGINESLPIRQMRYSRQLLTGSDQVFEIKHLTDWLVSVKTRGQIGYISTGHAVLLARFNLRPPLSDIFSDDQEKYKEILEAGGVIRDTEEAKWIEGYLKKIEDGADEIDTYPFITLNKFHVMLESAGDLDMTKKVQQRKINTDYDWKRQITWNDPLDTQAGTSPFTSPHQDWNRMVIHRKAMESIRKSGKVARPEEVLSRTKIKGNTLRSRGSKPADVTRLFLRGILQGKITLSRKLQSCPQEAKRINQIWQELQLTEWEKKHWKSNRPGKYWTEVDFKNAKRGQWESGRFPKIAILVDLVVALSRTFSADPEEAKSLLFDSENFDGVHMELIEYVITAIGDAHRIGISPFDTLYSQGLLPGRSAIVKTFCVQLPEERIDECLSRRFNGNRYKSLYTKQIKRLFSLLGIPGSEVQKCTERLVETGEKAKRPRKNPGQKLCLKHFVQALQQNDIRNSEMEPSDVLKRLGKFGLTSKQFSEYRKERFMPNCIKKTSLNKRQITQMAKACGHDPLPLLSILLETQ